MYFETEQVSPTNSDK